MDDSGCNRSLARPDGITTAIKPFRSMQVAMYVSVVSHVLSLSPNHG